MDGAHLEINGFEATESLFNGAEVFVALHRFRSAHGALIHTGADHIHPVQKRFFCDFWLIAFPAKGVFFYFEHEVFGHLEALNEPADSQCNFGFASQRAFFPLGGEGDLLEFHFGCPQKGLTLGAAVLG